MKTEYNDGMIKTQETPYTAARESSTRLFEIVKHTQRHSALSTTQTELVRVADTAEKKILTHAAAQLEAKAIKEFFNSRLSYDQLSWLERRFIERSSYKKGMNIFFENLDRDINRGELRTYDAAVTAATLAIAKNPNNGVQVKTTMLKKIRQSAPEFKLRYIALRNTTNNSHFDAL